MKLNFSVHFSTAAGIFFLCLCSQSIAVGCPQKDWHNSIGNPHWKDIPNLPREGYTNQTQKEANLDDLRAFLINEIEEYRHKLKTLRKYNESVREETDECLKNNKIDHNRYDQLQEEYQDKIDYYQEGIRIYGKLYSECRRRIERAYRTYPGLRH